MVAGGEEIFFLSSGAAGKDTDKIQSPHLGVLVSLIKEFKNRFKQKLKDNPICIEQKTFRGNRLQNLISCWKKVDGGDKEKDHGLKIGMEVRHMVGKSQHGGKEGFS